MKIEFAVPRLRRVVKTALITLLTSVVVLGILYFPLVDVLLSHSVPRAEILGFVPSDAPLRAVPERQLEGHTCGLHMLRSLYRAHALNPDEHLLRVRLGVDRGAVPAVKSTQGTLQPDLTRVLAQDGFLVNELDLERSNAAALLSSHLDRDWFAVTLIVRPRSGQLHWVLIQAV